ncbi:MAG: 3-deoxy-8-phosphooctulonate synthase [Endomicrobium sp.]|jgi:2-dehydro-3-deoxyphosphooctonate aldolase (KDO 8-P synthase)|uniref:3-deoxy-8-phosphooctulonate synthase n=1 Tax=Candidatus Endomicrobiellum cubanum TaxID=3242325 RepID=UPI0028350E86|nr:3-deoxy-8-phosphooctulonate synthase [Endomicrobium sp.]
MQNKCVKVGRNIFLSNSEPLVIIAGPCVIESENHAFKMAVSLKKITSQLKIPFVFKSSYDKANRSSVQSYRGPGIEEGLKILAKIKKELKIPVITDVHLPQQAARVAEFVDFLQVPAFLSRQTDLIKACAVTGKPVNVKKGQFLAPEDMFNVIKKFEKFGNNQVSLTERGASFGYHNLVVDFRGLEIMKNTKYPVIFDATHSVQFPGGGGTYTAGNREFIVPLSKAATALGISALFIEVHDNPNKAFSDGANSLDLKDFKEFIKAIKAIDKVAKCQKI